MTPEEKQRIYEEEKAREEAKQKIAFEREYGGCFGKVGLALNILLALLKIGFALIFVAILLWMMWEWHLTR